MLAAIDYTAVLVAVCGVLTALIGGVVAIRLKKLELRAAAAARRAERAEEEARKSAVVAALPKKRPKRPPDHPCS